MRKVSLILISICLIYGTFHQSPPLHSKIFFGNEKKNGNENNPKYRFEYQIQGETSGLILFIFRYRVFFFATASVLLTTKKIDEKTLQFHFENIDKAGYLIGTRGFSGKTLITAAADYDLKKAQQILDKDFAIFKEKAPDFSRVIRRRKTFPFKILSQGQNVMAFKRDINGIHRDCSINMQIKSIKYKKKYDFNFKIYPMLLEMVKTYSHSFFPGNWETVSEIKPGMEWHSPELDFSNNMNRIGARASTTIEKFVTFRQRTPFKLAYRVVSKTPGMLTILGEAVPQVKIWDGYKIVQVTRTIKMRLPDGVVLEDKFYVEIRKEEGKCGSVQCALTLIQ